MLQLRFSVGDEQSKDVLPPGDGEANENVRPKLCVVIGDKTSSVFPTTRLVGSIQSASVPSIAIETAVEAAVCDIGNVVCVPTDVFSDDTADRMSGKRACVGLLHWHLGVGDEKLKDLLPTDDGEATVVDAGICEIGDAVRIPATDVFLDDIVSCKQKRKRSMLFS